MDPAAKVIMDFQRFHSQAPACVINHPTVDKRLSYSYYFFSVKVRGPPVNERRLWSITNIHAKGPLQLKKLVQSLAGEVIFSIEIFTSNYPM